MVIGCSENGLWDTWQLHRLDLSDLFVKVLRAWGMGPVRRLGPVPERTSYLPLERMVTLTGAVQGYLVVRSTRDFALQLRDQRENTPLGRYPEEEVFEELISLFCLYLFHAFWRPELFQIGPIHPFPSIPGDWPLAQPTASCSLSIGGQPLEIRLWTAGPPDRG